MKMPVRMALATDLSKEQVLMDTKTFSFSTLDPYLNDGLSSFGLLMGASCFAKVEASHFLTSSGTASD